MIEIILSPVIALLLVAPSCCAVWTASLCGTAAPRETITLTCPTPDSIMDGVVFARMGNPRGACGQYDTGTCSVSIDHLVARSCLGKASCAFKVPKKLPFPCQNATAASNHPIAAVQVKCVGLCHQIHMIALLIDSLLQHPSHSTWARPSMSSGPVSSGRPPRHRHTIAQPNGAAH